jgi:SNARE protein
MADLNYWYDEYSREVEQFRELVEKLKQKSNDPNEKMVEMLVKDCEQKILRVKEVKKSFTLELKLARDKTLRADFEGHMKEVDAKSDQLMKDFSLLKASNQKNSLFGDAVPTYQQPAAGRDNDSLLKDTHVVQDKTFEALARTRNLVQASKEIGAATVEQLVEQKEQIKSIEADIDAMDTNLIRAGKLVNNFARRMATDRIIQFFTAVNIVVLLGLILYVAGSGKSLTPSHGSSGGGPADGSSFRPTISPTLAPF